VRPLKGEKRCNFERKDGLAIARRLPDLCYAYLRWDRVTARKILKNPAFSIRSFDASEWTVGVSAFGDLVIFSPAFRNRFTCIAARRVMGEDELHYSSVGMPDILRFIVTLLGILAIYH